MAKKSTNTKQIRDNPPLAYIMLLLPLLWGGYYNFIVLLMGGILVCLMAYSVVITGKLRIPGIIDTLALLGILLGNIIACFTGVSGGMAFVGVLRVVVWCLFCMYLCTYNYMEKQYVLKIVSYEGAGLALLTIILYFNDIRQGVVDANGRIDGLFEYANTWALFLLVCLITLATKKPCCLVDWVSIAVLVAGIYFSGSRGIFLLLLPLMFVYGLWHLWRFRRLSVVILGVIGLIALGLIVNYLTQGMVLSRIQAISLTSSSVNGRILYYLDGLSIVKSNPLGIGYGGYLYMQPLYQTGAYTVKYVHNGYLQMTLDGGLLAGISMVVLILHCMFKKGITSKERLVVGVIALHMCIDFDSEFFVIVAILLLCGCGAECKELSLSPKLATGVLGTIGLLMVYMTGVYYFDFSGQADRAYSGMPWDLSLAEKQIQNCGTHDEIQELAHEICETTQLSMLAWDGLFLSAQEENDWEMMLDSKFHYLLLNPYRGEVFVDMIALMERGILEDDIVLQNLICNYAQETLAFLKSVQERTHTLAYALVESPEWDFVTDASTRLGDLIATVEEGILES